jgi:hypothetical protein
LSNFNNLDQYVQTKLLSLIDDELHKDDALLRTILKFQVDKNIQPARELFEKRDIAGFMQLLSTVTVESAILLHLEVALVYPQLIEASGTLSRTLLPLINKVTNFNFLTQESHFIFGRFLNAMLLHHKDTNEPLGAGIILLALTLNPQALRNMWGIAKNISSLKDAL